MDPRIAHTHRVVREAALEELAAVGYGEFSVEGVAARSGVAKSTIYRHWDGRSSLVSDALAHLVRQPAPVTGESARTRVRQLLLHLVEGMADPTLSATTAALVDAAERDRAIADLHHQSNDRRRQALVEAITDGVADGEIPDHVEPEAGALALAGAIIYRRLMTADPADPEDVDALVATVLGPPA